MITAKKKGTVTIKATVNGGTISCKVTVKTHSHDYSSTIIKGPSCTEKGVRKYTCSCGKSYTESIAQKQHKESEWIVAKEATYSENGKREKVCVFCDKVLKTEIIDKLIADSVDTYENCREEILERVNKEREKVGLQPLELYDILNDTAQEKAIDLYETEVFSHYSENLGYFYDQYNRRGLEYSAGAENIAMGYGAAESVVNGWMNSQGHRDNILGNFTHMGLGFYKGYWVQQFATDPKVGEIIDCPNCDGVIKYDEYQYTSKDYEGNVYGIYQCESCYILLEKCPKCPDGFFEDAGLTIYGSLSAKCNVCGHNQKETCIDKCVTCNEEILNNTHLAKYLVTSDSTKTYDGNSYSYINNCYFQQFIIEGYICKNCDTFCLVKQTSNYEEAYELLEERIVDEGEIFNYIFWEKQVGYERIEKDGNTTSYRPTYEFVETPKILRLEELIGKNEL